MSGIKLTVLLPLLNQLIRDVTINQGNKGAQSVVILCHSAMRCTEMEGFLKELLAFCQDVIEIIDLYNGDKQENAIHLKKALTPITSSDPRVQIKARCKVIVSTPTQYLEILKAKVNAFSVTSLFVDKVDMHIALDLTNELVKIGELSEIPSFKTIITTQFKGAEADETELLVKKALMGETKALIIQVNDDQRVKSRFERLEHYYI